MSNRLKVASVLAGLVVAAGAWWWFSPYETCARAYAARPATYGATLSHSEGYLFCARAMGRRP